MLCRVVFIEQISDVVHHVELQQNTGEGVAFLAPTVLSLFSCTLINLVHWDSIFGFRPFKSNTVMVIDYFIRRCLDDRYGNSPSFSGLISLRPTSVPIALNLVISTLVVYRAFSFHLQTMLPEGLSGDVQSKIQTE